LRFERLQDRASMQSRSWYLHRLKAMSPDEIWWRLSAGVRDRADRVRLPFNAFPRDRALETEAQRLAIPAPPKLCDVEPGAWQNAAPGTLEHGWRESLVLQADAVARHRLRVFGLELDLGRTIDWNRDHVHGISTPLGFAQAIDYRDYRAVGDAKIVWEPNRHQHLVVLARAYRATGDPRYAASAVEQLTSWLDQCPVARGMNWRSPLELALRLINWTWTIDLIRDSGCLTPDFCRRLLRAVHLHMWEVGRKFSRGSSANNHLIGEAAGVFVASSYFQAFKNAGSLRDASFRILNEEIVAQTHEDGGTREQAIAYHLFVLQLLLVAGVAGRETGCEFGAPFWQRLEKMIEFASLLAEGGPLPAYGDSDDGYVLDLGRANDDLASSICAGAVLFARPDFKAQAGGFQQPVRWLLGADSRTRFDAIAEQPPSALESRALADSGYYLLQYGAARSPASVSVVFDCGPLGFTALAAHGHADALSFTLRAFGSDVIIDAGTFDYFTHPTWREYFRSTRAHNTVLVDGVDQSEQLGSFLWGARAVARCLAWRPRPDGGSVTGEHEGYRRLPDPVTHRRTLELDASHGTLVVRDALSMAAPHEIQVFFHVVEHSEVARSGEHSFDLRLGVHLARVHLDPALTWELRRGREEPIDGWVSRAYHDKEPAVAIVGTLRADRDVAIETRFEFVPSAFAT
jgi:hypothetical protein